ncbi:MAG: ABC transporter ATP-binding protein [Clostridiaceae bacterium]|nr:ABC transporter ATP-binding protein [Clostridiaceae bacterium]
MTRRLGHSLVNKSDILRVENLKVTSANGAELVRDISLNVKRGEIVGLVGESGSGKSITIMSIAGLLPKGISIASGRVFFEGRDITKLTNNQRQTINGSRLGVIYQDAAQALNPLMTIGKQIGEVLQIHTKMPRKEIKYRILAAMRAVNLPDPEKTYKSYPHELSGGQRQRVLIAMAIINNPELLIADEPTTALDVNVKIQVLELIKIINESKNLSVLYISHDLSTIQHICDRVYVLYAGIPVEVGRTEQIIHEPKHPYTSLLIDSAPTKEKRGKKLAVMKPRVQDQRGPATNCQFASRCPFAFKKCYQKIPHMISAGKNHEVACFLYNKNFSESEKIRTSEQPDEK